MGKLHASRYDAPDDPLPLRLTKDDFLFRFQKMHRHGALPRTILEEYTPHLSPGHPTRHRLKRLQRKGYLVAPWQQKSGPGYLGTNTFRDITPAALKEMRRGSRYLQLFGKHYDIIGPRKFGPWKHDAGVASVCACLEIAATRDGNEYIFHDEIVKRIGTDYFMIGPHKVFPDRLGGIRYPGGEVTIFIVELIRGDNRRSNEQLKKRQDEKKSIESMIDLYTDFIQSGQAQDDLMIRRSKTKIKVLMVNTTTPENQYDEEGNRIYEHGEPPTWLYTMMSMTKHNAFLFNHVPFFGREIGNVQYMPYLYHNKWHSAKGDVFIDSY